MLWSMSPERQGGTRHRLEQTNSQSFFNEEEEAEATERFLNLDESKVR